MKICLDCSVGSLCPSTRGTLLKQVASRLKCDLEDDRILLAEANEMVTELENNLQKSSGPSRKKFEEVLRSDNDCELVRNLRNAMPDAVVTPKLHLVAAHLVPYLRANQSWGRLTEQSIEAFHALFNTLNCL
uniref:Uncharacterized protein n=1 Tax=Caenorhabditis japonica TaxID=281687 RepID=A0A8R1I8N8_CAEJA